MSDTANTDRASKLDSVDLSQVARQRAQYAKELVDHAFDNADGDRSVDDCWEVIGALGDVIDRLEPITVYKTA